MTLAALREVAPQLPTFDEALELLGRDRSRHPRRREAARLRGGTADAIRRHGLVERTVVSSVFADSLRRFAMLEPGLARGLHLPARPARDLAAAVASAGRRRAARRASGRASKAARRHARSRTGGGGDAPPLRRHRARWSNARTRTGPPCWPGRSTTPKTSQRVLAAGVDGVITNDPQILGRCLHSAT